MDERFARWLVDADDERCGTQARVMEGYSGRGMYGEETCAVSTDDAVNLLLSAVWEAAENPGGVPAAKPDELRIDSLGKGEVVY